MARRMMTEKLDNITHGELGIQFDEGFVWEKLESKLGGKQKPVHYRWMIAAAIFLGVLFVPLTILKEEAGLNTIHNLATEVVDENDQLKVDELIVVPRNSTFAKRSKELFIVTSKSIELEVAGIRMPALAEIVIDQPAQEKIKPQFAVEDISIIQGSLENASINDRRIEKGRTMSIRAHGYNSPIDEVDNEQYQGLKIKLYEQKN